jgi:hypothetical protein
VDGLLNNLNHPETGDFKPTTLTCALVTLKINTKSPNYFHELQFFREHLPRLLLMLEDLTSLEKFPFVEWH